MYGLCRSLLFQLNPEVSHHVALGLLPYLTALKSFPKYDPKLSVECMGIKFPNPVGLAAGLDKDGLALSSWPKLGFGFMEIGTVTPRPQPGNPKPRLFRLKEDRAIINRMGFNNNGVEALIKRLQKFRSPCPIGVNIGKNRDTDLIDAHRDYAIAFEAVYPYADYVTVNISSPNTPGLKSLQHGGFLNNILETLVSLQDHLRGKFTRRVPIVVKLSPDLTQDELTDTVKVIMQWSVDGIIATNTTIERPDALKSRFQTETGGLSGAPLTVRATEVLKHILDITNGDIPVISAGGIMTVEDAMARFDAGASLIQLYSGFIYHGPALVSNILKRL